MSQGKDKQGKYTHIHTHALVRAHTYTHIYTRACTHTAQARTCTHILAEGFTFAIFHLVWEGGENRHHREQGSGETVKESWRQVRLDETFSLGSKN